MSVIPPKKPSRYPAIQGSLAEQPAGTLGRLADLKLITLFKTRWENFYNMQELLDYLNREQELGGGPKYLLAGSVAIGTLGEGGWKRCR